MRQKRVLLIFALFVFCAGGALVLAGTFTPDERSDSRTEFPETIIHTIADEAPEKPDLKTTGLKSGGNDLDIRNNEAPLPSYLQKSLQWLAQAQRNDGGFGAGSHSRQDIRDPHAVPSDPATTAFVGLSFIRAGNTHASGPYKQQVKGALDFLLATVEALDQDAQRITDLTGTQPQTKLGHNIDATMASQFLTRMLEFTEYEHTLHERIQAAIQTCVDKIQSTQTADGNFAGGSWAGALQSSMANNALEVADVKASGAGVDRQKLRKSRGYQSKKFDSSTGSISTEDAAGVGLYSWSSTNRATAVPAKIVETRVKDAKDKGLIDEDAEVSEETLEEIGFEKEEAKEYTQAYKANTVSRQQLQRDEVLSGFGNNGGEEFLSYMMTSESLVITGGEDWTNWNKKMSKRLTKIQNTDGSWSGHHCITSPVFCTAAAVMTLTTDRDAEYIASIAMKTSED